jgi:bifunctional non-homologous end joining protein LigD
VLIDWSQNTWHKSTACVYSLRATPQPQVSMPLSWEELEEACRRRDPEMLRFGPDAAVARLQELGDLFEPAFELTQELPAGA